MPGRARLISRGLSPIRVLLIARGRHLLYLLGAKSIGYRYMKKTMNTALCVERRSQSAYAFEKARCTTVIQLQHL